MFGLGKKYFNKKVKRIGCELILMIMLKVSREFVVSL